MLHRAHRGETYAMREFVTFLSDAKIGYLDDLAFEIARGFEQRRCDFHAFFFGPKGSVDISFS